MKIIAYFVFTILSILIQFCVMDFIQGRLQISQKQTDLSETSQKVKFSNIFKNISNVKPHALYYNKRASSFTWNNAEFPMTESEFKNSSISFTTTDNPSIFEFYDENSSITEFTSTTEDIIVTSTEVGNITEITFFNSKNQSSNGNNVSKNGINKDCACNFLHNICDIDCCCDYDCNDDERKLFNCFKDKTMAMNKKGCYHFYPHSNMDRSNILNRLFCVVKTNLPHKRKIKQEKTAVLNFYKWRESIKASSPDKDLKFSLNNSNEFIWILNNGSTYYYDIPTLLINNYCMDRLPVKILKGINSICNVKLNDLEMFHILNIFEEGTIISPIDNSINSTVLNCSSFFCTRCNIMACDNDLCVTYNKSIHEPTCNENICTNLALRIDLLFFYYEAKITDVTLKLHMENISMAVPFVTQEIKVDFLLSNNSKDFLELSGSPGYLIGRPVIISHQDSNHTEYFYKNSSRNFYLRRPDNKNGLCILSNNSNNFLLFGINKRTKCKYTHTKKISNANATTICKDINKNIKTLFGFNDKMFVSPYGNPYGVKDEDWIEVENTIDSKEITGDVDSKTSKLNCNNVAASVSFVFSYEELENNNGNKILKVEYEVLKLNYSFDDNDISSIITINVNFVDLTMPEIEEYAARPYIDFGLPNGFFYPFPNNNANLCRVTAFVFFIYCIPFFFK